MHGPRPHAATNQIMAARHIDKSLLASSLNEVPQQVTGTLMHLVGANIEDVSSQAIIQSDGDPKKKLKDNAPTLAKMNPENIMSVLEGYLSCDEKEYIMQGGKPLPLRIIDTIDIQLENDITTGYEALLKGLAGLHTNLFEEYTGRKAQAEEADFCMEKFKNGLKEEILNEGHKADRITDEEINLDKNYVELR